MGCVPEVMTATTTSGRCTRSRWHPLRTEFEVTRAQFAEFVTATDHVADGCAIERAFDRDWTAADCRDGVERTAPVGSFTPDGFDSHDMAGNV